MQNRSQKYKFMNENLNSNRIEEDDFNLNVDEHNYDNLINRLKQIRSTILLLEKKYFDKLNS